MAGPCLPPVGVEECSRVHFLCMLKSEKNKKRRVLSAHYWR